MGYKGTTEIQEVSDACRSVMSSTCGNGCIAVAELHAIGLDISTRLISDTNPHFTVSLFPTIGGLRWLSEEQQSQAPKCCSGFKSTAEAMDSRLPFPFPPDAKLFLAQFFLPLPHFSETIPPSLSALSLLFTFLFSYPSH